MMRNNLLGLSEATLWCLSATFVYILYHVAGGLASSCLHEGDNDIRRTVHYLSANSERSTVL